MAPRWIPELVVGTTITVKSITCARVNDGSSPNLTTDATANTAAEAGGFAFKRARAGTGNAKIATLDGDTLGNCAAAGYNGTGYDSAANIAFRQDGNVVGANVPGKIVFQTAPYSGSLADALVIRSDKTMEIAGVLKQAGINIGFRGSTAVGKATITGSRASTTQSGALGQLLQALQDMGITTGLGT